MMKTAHLPDLSNRIVLITGASSGIGAHFAHAVTDAGGAVVLAARRADRLTALANELKTKGCRAFAVAMDVSDEASIIAGFDAAEAGLGPIDSVICNAGMNKPASALGIAADDWRQVMEVNVNGVFLTAREAARRMIQAGSVERMHGRIVLVGSVGSHRVMNGLAAYNSSKAAVLMMGKSLAREWAAKGINVNTICPGWIATELNSEWLATEAGQTMIATMPRKRVMQPEDLDGITLHLLSDAARTITGGGFELDDGQSL